MKALRLVKRFKNMTPGEESTMALALDASPQVIGILTDFLQNEVLAADKKLSKTETLYKGEGDRALYVACLLAKREAHLTLLNLLTEKINLLDVDHTGD